MTWERRGADIAIRFEGVSKRYRLNRGWYFSIRDEMARQARRLVRRAPLHHDELWALRNVSFEVERGETLGVIGPNGAGKSTALKILSRVTAPSGGAVFTAGRVGSLLELGAGFHPELSGRENVYLNGAIMGMRQAEIARKFDSIVAFAEVERFIDTPIKHYSSGMTVRLGFAVAVHTDPEIFLIDEVLAVGDAAFQAKCLNKLAELKRRERTIVLVSHNMVSLLQHANRVLWIDRGVVRAWGAPEPIVEDYLRSVQARSAAGRTSRSGEDSGIAIREVSVTALDGPAGALQYGKPAVIEVVYEMTGPVVNPVVSVSFEDVRGAHLGGLTTRLDGVEVDTSRPRGVVRLVLDPVLFCRGAYGVSVAVYDSDVLSYLDLRSTAATFTVDGPGVASRDVSGHLVYPHRWEVGS